ncbi:MAG TPA: Rho termination factor N-terminal domain-containing protein, partial [Salegentibacter sp.]|nr:Rho termination factor N-terminal domain-containing protein [Salegentibacter sp.]
MFEISELKTKKLPELQEIAKSLNVPKFRSLKKLDLVYQILDHQAANPSIAKEVLAEESAKSTEPSEKPQNKRTGKVGSDKKPHSHKRQEATPKKENSRQETQSERPEREKPQPRQNKRPDNRPSKDSRDDNRGNQREKQDNRSKNTGSRDNGNRDNGNRDNNNRDAGNRDSRNRYREPDYEFDAIIESEGVLDIMQDNYGFLRSSD